MDPAETLRSAILTERTRLAATVPADGTAAVLALLAALDREPTDRTVVPPSDPIFGHRLRHAGANRAIRFCLESGPTPGAADGPDPGHADSLRGWATRFLAGCDGLVAAERVADDVAAGIVRLVGGDGRLDAWPASRRIPAAWRERADIDRWAARLARRHPPTGAGSGDPGAVEAATETRLAAMGWQMGYPPDAEFDGIPTRRYTDTLRRLIALTRAGQTPGEPVRLWPERALVDRIAADLAADPDTVAQTVAGFTVDRDSIGWHAAVPGVAPAPLVRVAADRLALSPVGLTLEPLLFLTRELRRRAPAAYHNGAARREEVFRADLSGLFADRRFLTSAGAIRLRRPGGDLSTDIDAVVFDRRTGALGVFELKTTEPFARTAAERDRQRESVLYANRQLSGTLDWLNRHGGDEILDRIDHGAAKRFRVRKVFPFVLGRYLSVSGDGPGPDAHAAWGTWPRVLELTDGRPFPHGDANPLASLFAGLSRPDPFATADAAVTLTVGGTVLTVHPSRADYQAAATGPERR